jgi:hypothetical protein
MKYHEHRPEVKFGLKYLLICKFNKRQGHVLMTKFSKSGKTGLSGLPLQNIWIWQFQSKTEEGAKLVDLNIQGVLK